MTQTNVIILCGYACFLVYAGLQAHSIIKMRPTPGFQRRFLWGRWTFMVGIFSYIFLTGLSHGIPASPR